MRHLSTTTTLLLISRSSAFFNSKPNPSAFAHKVRNMSATTELKAKPFAVMVEAEIQPDRMGEFLKMIENNAIETRKEPGCIRFDVLRDQGNPNKFFFYEVYENPAAIDHHKQQPHYNAWAEFKESGGTTSSVSHKTDGEFMT